MHPYSQCPPSEAGVQQYAPEDLLTEAALAAMHPRQAAVMRALYGIGCARLSKAETCRAFRLSSQRLEYSRGRILKGLRIEKLLKAGKGRQDGRPFER